MKDNETKVPKVWGSENIITNNGLYCLKFLHLKQGHRCSMHYHRIKDETFFILSGKVKLDVLHVDDNKNFELKEETMHRGSHIRIKPNTLHRFYGIEDSTIIEVSTMDMADDSYRITESEKVINEIQTTKED